MSLLEVTETLCAHDPNDRPFIVGIDGLGGAGKTTFVKKLSRELKNRHREVMVLPLDDYIVETKKRYETGYEEWYEYYYLQWDIRLLETELFKKLRNNSTDLTLPYYDRATDTIMPKHIHLTSSTIVLIEGVFLQRDEWRDYFDYVLFIDCSRPNLGIGTFFVLKEILFTNPVTILSFMAIFSGLGLATTGATAVNSFSLVLGVFLGSALWWLLLSSLAGAVEHRMKKRSLHVIHRVSGLMLLGFGVWSLGNWLMGV
ncbi:kinase [Halalkalibacterium halodurans]|uniref:kinase n=1 Tax=Halalkalibacterium halodurans TaxID=86665 RepID=UPI0009FA66CE|nr:kinase [Halalkalibacterium halodurans]MDY7220824.1 kinase [Halalkalibacterium halodurans]MDY7240063.1 kinase [Halalkalibacterium halodurans]TPE68840.1 hypothetical protein AMD02_011025 [Halalkalibacterium halodurans]